MDILEQYEKENPQVETLEKWEPPEEYSFLMRLIVKLSGGRIREERQIIYVLLVAVGLMFLATILIFVFSGPSSEGKARFSTVCFPVPCQK